MKKFLAIAALLVSASAFSQNPYTITKVIETDSVGVQAIHTALREWVATAYNSAKDVIQMDDKEAGIIVISGSTDYSKSGLSNLSFSGWIDYTLKINIKNNRYRVEVTNFRHKVKPGNAQSSNMGLITTAEESPRTGIGKGSYNKVWVDIKEKMNLYSIMLIGDMVKKTESLVNKKTATGTQDNW